MARRPDPRRLSLFDIADTAAPTPFDHARWDGRSGETPIDRALIEAGLSDPYGLSIGGGTLQDTSVPYLPRSLRFPVRLIRDRFSSETRPPRFYLSTPACADLPFVRRVEDITGLKAVWDGASELLGIGTWYHAIDLATDEGWETLAASLGHTTLAYVSRAVAHQICWGGLSVANGRSLLERAAVPRPDDPARETLRGWAPGLVSEPDSGRVSGWCIVLAVEAGWMRPGRNGGRRQTRASFTPAGRSALDAYRASIPKAA
ncbi:hypothetical protein [Methylobacterium sp. yr668]|uniref:hypothetical protein n=1 Tax=Methylobacterium sp. yr668 TaxID=1761801 RepID=UPI0008DF3BF6|nr:hypothetical protein [Methylobacterium sp. yr668]SFT30420.1 hypothetical protein SAMN04487845_1753 [Methylobacterium sp. yr668]